MKILLLSDGQNWIVDRISNEFIKRIPHDIELDYYTTIDPRDFITKASSVDLVHSNNANIGRLYPTFEHIKTPILVSVRSFRYPASFTKQSSSLAGVHVIHPDLLGSFNNATYIPDGIFEGFEDEFVVGMACQDGEWSKKYKGYYLVEEACKRLGVAFKPVHNLKPEQMPEYYKSLNLYVCASENEGCGTPVLECMSLNVPVLTTDVGIAKFLDIAKCERNVESIEEGILKFYTFPQVKDYTWENSCKKLTKLYECLQ
jgi:glycosyltransferase involved in cell wall biosynthesis